MADRNNQVPVNTAPASNVYVNQDAEWAKNASDTIPILVNDIINMSGAATDDLYTTSLEFENYKKDLDTAIANCDSFKVSQELQSFKNEYRAGLVDDNNAATFLIMGFNFIKSGDTTNANDAYDKYENALRSSNRHYDNATTLLEFYNNAHPDAQLDIPVTNLMHNITQEDSQPTPVATPLETTKPEEKNVKTLDDYEREPETPQASDYDDDSENANTESTNSVASSTHSIFDYCTWQAQITKKIGDYFRDFLLFSGLLFSNHSKQ
jgi:hypothetical protein